MKLDVFNGSIETMLKASGRGGEARRGKPLGLAVECLEI